MEASPGILQISLPLSAEHTAIVLATAASVGRRVQDQKAVGENAIKNNDGYDLKADYNKFWSPFNICISRSFSDLVRSLHKSLDTAITDLVERWFEDEKARFPERMPLEKREEGLLRWIHGPGSEIIPPFRGNYGMWRTDYLIERSRTGTEQAKICEINSRIAVNAIWIVGLHEAATRSLTTHRNVFKPLNQFEKTKTAVLNCFDRSKPLYHISETWPKLDSACMAREYQKQTGQPVIFAKPKELHLRPDAASPTGYKLFYRPEHIINGEPGSLQEIRQCSLELFQEEYATLDPLIVRQIATMCVNDLRNVYLVHDKRILGIILEELPSMLKRGVLTAEEVDELERGICETLLPGTPALKHLLQRSRIDETQKNLYIIKPVRDASGNGIKLGSSISQTEWIEILEKQCSHALRPDEGACVVQRLVDHIWYDIVRHEGVYGFNGETDKFHLIGAYHMINSKLGVFGPWRVGEDVHIGVAGEGSRGIASTSVLRPEGMKVLGKDDLYEARVED